MARFTKPKGTEEEQKLFTIVNQHYKMAKEDNESRWADWDSKYELFRNYINENNWPYQSLIFIPQTFSSLFEKMARLNGGKPKGRLIPREGGDIVRAKINNEMLDFQWDEASRIDNDPMIAKWALMDLQTRIFGASFGIAKWEFKTDESGETKFDGPNFKVLNPKDSLPNPSYSAVKNWFQYRDWLTIEEMERVNDVSGEKPVYKNLDLLRKSVKDKGGDSRDTEYDVFSKNVSTNTDYLGKDEAPEFKIIEVVTELRDNKKIVFAPKHGVIVQDRENPYKHKQIPVIHLRYIRVDDDVWGLSEIEPVEKIQKAMNALASQFVDSVNMDLYRVLKINPAGVDMNSLEWGAGKKWKMNNPATDVVPLDATSGAMNQFVNVYGLLAGIYKEAMGDAGGAFSSLEPFGGEKTATEIRETQFTRSIRDNFNQIFMAEAIKKLYTFWFLMNQQFIFSDPSKEMIPLRVVGKEAISKFKEMGLDAYDTGITEEEALGQADLAEEGIEPELRQYPRFPVQKEGKFVPKMELDTTGEVGTIYMTPEDMTGNYDFIIDVEPMRALSSMEEKSLIRETLSLIMNPATVQLLQMEGKSVKFAELLGDSLEKLGFKGSEKYFDVAQQQGAMNGQTNQAIGGGVEGGQGGGIPGGAQVNPGMVGSTGMVAEEGLAQLG